MSAIVTALPKLTIHDIDVPLGHDRDSADSGPVSSGSDPTAATADQESALNAILHSREFNAVVEASRTPEEVETIASHSKRVAPTRLARMRDFGAARRLDPRHIQPERHFLLLGNEEANGNDFGRIERRRVRQHAPTERGTKSLNASRCSSHSPRWVVGALKAPACPHPIRRGR
jgi:hypothetical protein